MPTAFGSIGVQRGGWAGAPDPGVITGMAPMPANPVQRGGYAGTPGRPGVLTFAARSLGGAMPTDRFCNWGLAEKYLYGSTSVNYSLVTGRKVRAYDRNTGKLLRTTISDAAGNFAIYGLGVASDAYFVALEQDNALDVGSYNLAAFDHVSQS